MNIKLMLSVTLGVAALTFSGLAASVDMANGHCMAKLYSANLESIPAVDGYLLHRQWPTNDGTGDSLEIAIDVRVPSNLPGFDNLATGVRTSFMVALERDYQVYAECTMNASRIITQRGRLRFTLGIEGTGAKVNSHAGLCDMNPWMDGIQPGMPVIFDGDEAKVYSVFKGAKTMVSEVKFEML